MLQIIGTPSSRDTQKAVRYCRERSIPFQMVDITKKELAEKEWSSIFASAPDADELIDKSSRFYKKNGYEYMEYDAAEELREHPEMLILPILRNKGRAHAGFDEAFIEAAR